MDVRRFWAAALVATLAFGADAPQLDYTTAVPAVLRVLPYDTNFESRGQGPFVVLVVSADAVTARAATAIKDTSAPELKKRPVKFVTTTYSGEVALQTAIDSTHASAVLAAPGLDAAVIKAIWEVAQDNQLYALALEERTVETMFPLGVKMEDGKPKIIINEKSSKAVGARFETVVLKLARVIRE
jgi:hypothetical protein